MFKQIITIIIILILTLLVAEKGLEKQERAECLKWQKWAQKYPGFYLTEWQKQQCKRYNIKIK